MKTFTPNTGRNRKQQRDGEKRICRNHAAPYRAHFEGRRTAGWYEWRAERETAIAQARKDLGALSLEELEERGEMRPGWLEKEEIISYLVLRAFPHPTRGL